MAEKQENIKSVKPKIETRYTIKQFMDNAEALGYSKSILAGAFYYETKNGYTNKEVDELVKKFLSKKVK